MTDPASLRARDLSRAHRMVRALEAGVVFAETFGDNDLGAPFGRYKESVLDASSNTTRSTLTPAARRST
jgi:acyl-CoA reductase-like NAD-dependent aldehyde dehydrogenase